MRDRRPRHPVFSWLGKSLSVLLLFAFSLPALAQLETVEIVRAFPNLNFTMPVGLVSDGGDYFYVVEKAGTIRVFENVPDVASSSVFMDIEGRVTNGAESGLLGLAFHPDYVENGYLYVYYVTGDDPERSIISRFTRSESAPLFVDLTSELVLLDIEQPASGHNGGDMAFGPDGYLYVVLGDGRCCNDPEGNAQDRTTLFGSMLRLDVDHPSGGRNYGIPSDNPFVENTEGWREEIYAYGFRNPWRFSFDRTTGDLWVGDVGEIMWEEVNIVEAGGNYGWPIMEGPECLGGGEDCDQTGLILPVHAYTHEVGISISGGHVYRGNSAPALHGYYLYGDWGFEKLWALDAEHPTTAESIELDPPEGTVTPGFITDFGEGPDGELYYTAYFRGVIYGFTSPPISTEPDSQPASLTLKSAFPNPFRGSVRLQFVSAEAGSGRITAYDVLGREVAVVFEEAVLSNKFYDVRFDAQSLPAGVYVFRVEVGGEVRTTKAIHVR